MITEDGSWPMATCPAASAHVRIFIHNRHRSLTFSVSFAYKMPPNLPEFSGFSSAIYCASNSFSSDVNGLRGPAWRTLGSHSLTRRWQSWCAGLLLDCRRRFSILLYQPVQPFGIAEVVFSPGLEGMILREMVFLSIEFRVL